MSKKTRRQVEFAKKKKKKKKIQRCKKKSKKIRRCKKKKEKKIRRCKIKPVAVISIKFQEIQSFLTSDKPFSVECYFSCSYMFKCLQLMTF